MKKFNYTLLDSKIINDTNGNPKVVSVMILYKDRKYKGKAACNDMDEFDPTVGQELAIARALKAARADDKRVLTRLESETVYEMKMLKARLRAVRKEKNKAHNDVRRLRQIIVEI